MADIEALSKCSNITMLSFLHNPVAAKPNYRLFVVHKFPMLRVLDFRQVKLKEKEAAKSLFKSKKGKDQLEDIEKSAEKRARTFTPGAPLTNGTSNNMKPGISSKLTPQQIKDIKMSIERATSLEDIERLNHMLRTGQVPGGSNENTNGQMVEEEDD